MLTKKHNHEEKVTNKKDYNEKTYVNWYKTPSKERYNNHTKSFKKKHLSKLSKHIFLARDKNLMLLYVCLLCLTEKLFDINSFFDEHVANLKSELINTSSFFK